MYLKKIQTILLDQRYQTDPLFPELIEFLHNSTLSS